MHYAAQASGGGTSVPTLLMLVALFAAMYFLLIRPNRRRRQQVAEMQSTIGLGDEILTIGGLYGVVTDLGDERVQIEVSPGVTNTYARSAIGQIITSADKPDEPESPDPGPTSLNKVIDTD